VQAPQAPANEWLVTNGLGGYASGTVSHANTRYTGTAHLGEACLGTISEINDGDAPHAPRGCFAQAWSVSETLRAWYRLNSSGS
jgi:glycogen debranching enzyme